MAARSGARGSVPGSASFTGVNGVEDRAEKPSWRGLVPSGEIEQNSLAKA
jgi:hypothetical protein